MTRLNDRLSNRAFERITELQTTLTNNANPQTKEWFEAYLKGVIPYRGLKLPQVRSHLKNWVPSLDSFPAAERISIAFALLYADYGEDKLAGILLLQEKLIPEGLIEAHEFLPQFAQVFQDGAIYDWSTCDWFCMRVLKTMVKREGELCARTIASWQAADSLWQRRASCIPFVSLAKHGDQNFPGFIDLTLEVCQTVVQSEERFSQTAAGWLLRELWLAAPDQVVNAIEADISNFSSEGLRYATEKMPREAQLRLRELRKHAIK